MKKLGSIALAFLVGVAFADNEDADKQLVQETPQGFRSWRLSVGGVMGFGVKASGRSNFSRFFQTSKPISGGAVRPGNDYEFDNGAYIHAGESKMTFGPSVGTRNWSISASDTSFENGERWLNFSNTQLGGGGVAGAALDEDGTSFGVSAELARTLIEMESGFGLDVGVGLSWMRAGNIIDASSVGTYNRQTYSYHPTNGTPLSDPNYNGLNGVLSGLIIPDGPSGAYVFYDDNFLGGGNKWDNSKSSGFYSTHANGDYQEVELSLVLRPWYEITDWWRVNGTIGAGLGYGIFDLETGAMFGSKGAYRMSDTANKIGFYGLVGGGTTFRLGRFDLSGEVLVRLFQDDIEVSNAYTCYTLEKPDFVVRVAVGMQF